MLKQDDIPFAYGGLIFNRIPSLRTYIPAHFLGESLAGAQTKVESLLLVSQNLPVTKDIAVTQQAFTSHYQESRPRIESIMFDVMQKYNLSIDQIGEVNTYLGDRISAAMAFSDPDLIEPDLVWLVGLFSTRRLPLGPLTHYLDHYSEVLHMEVGEISEPIVLWMKTLVTKLKNGHQSIGWSDYE